VPLQKKMNKFFNALLRWPTGIATNANLQAPARGPSPETIEDNSADATRRQLLHVVLRGVMRRHGIPAGWIECEMIRTGSRRTRNTGIHLRLVIRHWDSRLMQYAFAFQKELLKEILRFEPGAAGWMLGMSWHLDVEDSCSLTTLPDKAFWQEAAEATALSPAAIPVTASSIPAAVPQIAIPAPAAKATAIPAVIPAAAPAVMPSGAALPPTITIQEPAKRSAPRLDYGASSLEASRPATETELTDDLARLFAIRDYQLEREAVQGLRPVGYEETQPGGL
jgi:hypothetical protein